MAKMFDEPIDKNIPWDGNKATGNLPVKGTRVEDFIKKSLDSKMGLLYYDTTNNRYIVFADAQSRDEYLEDPTKTELILGTFDAPFNYTAEIKMLTPIYNAVFYGSTGNYLQFTYDIKNKSGASTGESANIVITCVWNGIKEEYRQIAHSGDTITFQLDDKLREGTNTVIVGVTGQTSLAATTVAVTYQSINLQLSDGLDISQVYDLSAGAQVVAVPFSLSGFGTKVVEWYVDGVLQAFDKTVDEVVETSTTRTKYISLNNLNQGRHSLQIRAYTTVNGEKFYTSTLYRDLLIYTGANQETIFGVAMTIPKEYGIIEDGGNPVIYDMVQYVPYTLRFATYSPKNVKDLNVQVKLGDNIVGDYASNNNAENKCIITPKTHGNQIVSLVLGSIAYEITSVVQKTSMNIQEITDALMLDFNCEGKSNNSANKDSWSYGDYEATFEGFDWNDTSGWNNGRLVINKGNSFSINFAPLTGKPTQNGRTIEFEFSTFNVEDDNTVICDLRNDSGYGILITATKVKLISEAGQIIETNFKSDENVRVSFVIHRSSGSTFKQLSFIYTNGVDARCINWDANDSYTSNTTIKFEGSEGACVRLKSILVYDNALTDNQILNNFELYRDTLEEMLEVYYRNDVYMEGSETFSPDKMASRLPYMLITGNIPVLENTNNKNTQIIVDAEYKNFQDPTRSFSMKSAAMTPQGTSSMGYPKKNFNLYSRKLDTTIVYDYLGNVVADKLYSFKEGAQPVDCWCFKADYAESSGTHNTTIAKMWGNSFKNAVVTTTLPEDNPHNVKDATVLRTNAQQIAIDNGYPYDVRTTIDGFPFLLFYRPTSNDTPIFIGKYNFNNDKSTESVFGFTGIEGFDNSRMQCWELLNNGNDLGLFKNVSNFDSGWKEAFESRYPDTKTPNLTDLKAFCTWMSSVTQADFNAQKWEHMDVFKMAGYYCYLMRHAAADQFVKNSMLTSEDGMHFYFILYDNDTINGLTNDGKLIIPFDANRDTLGADGSYLFAGHESRLWNMLEADAEFMHIVRDVDNALYSAGISYTNAIKMFDTEQADKWVERVYNQDAQYKYVGPFKDSGINNLFMLQGKRDLHRRYWLAKRYAIYDSKFVTGGFKAKFAEIKCINDTPSGQQITITAGENLDYGYGINNIVREANVSLNKGEKYTFVVNQKLNLGDPLAIYGAPYLKEIDLSAMTDRLNEVKVANVYDDTLGTKLETLVIGNAEKENNVVPEVSGLIMAKKLRVLDIQNMKNIKALDLSEQKNFTTLKAFGSGVVNITFSKGASITKLELPSSFTQFSIEQLPKLTVSGVSFEDISVLKGMDVKQCPQLSNDFSFVKDWYDNKTTEDKNCSLVMDNVDWTNVTAEEFLSLCQIKTSGGQFDLSGKVSIPTLTLEQATTLVELFGDKVFSPSSKLYIKAPAQVFITGATSLLEGESEQYNIINIGGEDIVSVEWSITSGASSYVSINESGLLITQEGLGTRTFTIQAIATTTSGKKVYKATSVSTTARTYPSSSNITLNGPTQPEDGDIYSVSITTEYTGTLAVDWSVTGDAANYVELIPNGLSATLKVRTMIESTTTGTIKAVVRKVFNNSSITTKSISISIVNENIAETDPTVCQAFFNAGLTSNASYITKDEAASIDDTTFANVDLKIKRNFTFEGLRYFTLLTKIPSSYFNGAYLSKVILPENITRIESNAFRSTHITEIIIPKSVKFLGGFMASSLRSIVLPDTLLEIDSSCFRETKITSITIPDSVTEIGTMAFMDCSLLESIKLSKNLIKIKDNLFTGCLKLKSIEVPDSVTTLCSACFAHCPSLESLYIGSGFNRIDDLHNSLFYYGTSYGDKHTGDSLTSIKISENNTTFSDKGCNAIYKGSVLWNGCKTSTIHEETTEIKPDAFRTIKDLTSVVIPNSVTTIGTYAFYSCKLANIVLGNNLRRINGSAFYNCSVDELIIPDTVETIESSAFGVINKLYIGSGLKSLPYSYYPSPFQVKEQIIVSENNQTYDSRDNCNAIIETSTNVLYRGCANTIIPNTVTEIAEKAFGGSNIKEITIPLSVTSIGNSAFAGCNNLEKVIILGDILKLSDYVFESCSMLKEIQLPTSISSIGSYAFKGCSSLTSIEIPNSVTTIGYYAFYQCSRLTSVVFGNSVTSIGYNAFYQCSGLTSIEIPNGVTKIDSYTFAFCSGLTSVKIPNSVTSIGNNAFNACSGLTSVEIPNSVTSIVDGAFSQCTSLTSLIIGNSVTSIGSRAFHYCSNLTSISIFKETAPNVQSGAFGTSTSAYTGRNTYNTGENILYVPSGATGYDTGYWLDPLQNAEKCGFTLSATL